MCGCYGHLCHASLSTLPQSVYVDFGAGGSKFKSQVLPHILNTHIIGHRWRGWGGGGGNEHTISSGLSVLL